MIEQELFRELNFVFSNELFREINFAFSNEIFCEFAATIFCEMCIKNGPEHEGI